jgi:hypothetical protein
MIGMNVRIDDVAHRFIAGMSDGVFERSALFGIAAGVDDGDAAVADDETDVGYGAVIAGIGRFMNAEMHMDSGRHLGNRQNRRGSNGSACQQH